MPRGRASGYDDQRDLILRRAAQLFARRGYAATSMTEVAVACELSKATLYHYFRDKYGLLFSIADAHVTRLEALVDLPDARSTNAEERLRELVRRIVLAYADAQDQHRVLTEDVRFLEPADRRQVLDKERHVVAAFARIVTELRPGADARQLAKPLTMLLFGMINWLFTWLQPDGRLDHAAMAPIVANLFLGGIEAVSVPTRRRTRRVQATSD